VRKRQLSSTPSQRVSLARTTLRRRRRWTRPPLSRRRTSALHLLLRVERREDVLIPVLPLQPRKATVQQADHEANVVAEDRTIGDHTHDDVRE
jgi:hypothetical protein